MTQHEYKVLMEIKELIEYEHILVRNTQLNNDQIAFLIRFVQDQIEQKIDYLGYKPSLD